MVLSSAPYTMAPTDKKQDGLYNESIIGLEADEQSQKSSLENVQVLHTNYIDHKLERPLCRKFDFRILPVLSMMYLCNSLDKSNLGNAKTAGLEKDLNLVGNQYNIILSVFFIPYVLCAYPMVLLGKKYGPSKVLSIAMFGFGSMTLISAGISSFGGLMTIRWFLGMFESGFFPLVIYYLTSFYRRGELARRLSLFYAASNIASAFSGLLAFGVFQIEGGSLANWRYLFLIEGTATVLFSAFAFFYLPISTDKCRFLNEEEKMLAFGRIQNDSSSVVNEKVSIKESFKVFRHFSAWVWVLCEMCLGVPLQSVSLFLPQIVARLGYSTVKTNLFTVFPNITGAVILVLLAFASDLTRLRFPFISGGFCFPVIGFIIYAAIDVVDHKSVAYFACFLMTAGTAAPSVLLSTWYNNNTANESRRAAITAIGVPAANVMGLVSSNIFKSTEAPDYPTALYTNIAFGTVGILITTGLGLWMVADNKKRNLKQRCNLTALEISTELLADGPKSPNYRWFL